MLIFIFLLLSVCFSSFSPQQIHFFFSSSLSASFHSLLLLSLKFLHHITPTSTLFYQFLSFFPLIFSLFHFFFFFITAASTFSIAHHNQAPLYLRLQSLSISCFPRFHFLAITFPLLHSPFLALVLLNTIFLQHSLTLIILVFYYYIYPSC